MVDKIKNYFTYIVRFTKSTNKKKVVQELLNEVRGKGLIGGIKSLLHKKSPYYDVGDFDITSSISANEYDEQLKIKLPYPKHPKVSIIIPMYNQVTFTYNCIHSIYENNEFKDYEIIVVDDCSSENTTLIKDNFEHIVLIKNEVNQGFLKSCNLAALRARGEYIVFLNNDTQVQKNWLSELLYIFENTDGAGLVGSKLIYPNGRLQEAGGIIWKDGSASNYGNQDDPEKPQYNYVKEVDYISGASIMILATLWNEIGGFDERYLPAYCEDSDLCFEVRKKGYKVIYQPFSVVVHFEGVSHGTDTKSGVKQYQIINQKKFFDKWQSELKLKSKKGRNIFSERDRTSSKKHVLVVDHYLPQIDKDAGSRTISNFIDVLMELGYSVKFMGENANTEKRYEKSFQLKGVEVLYGKQLNFHLQKWKFYFKTNANNIDAILLSRSSVCTPLMTYLKNKNYKAKTIYYGHDLGYQRLEAEANITNDKAVLKEAKKLKGQEDFMYKNADNALVISFEEMGYLKKYIDTPLHYIPPYFFNISANNISFDEREGLLFVGGFNHPPNRDAMIWFLDEVYESLHQKNIRLTIAGSKIPTSIYKYKQRFNLLTILPDVSVEKLDELYVQTRVAIVPLLTGAGVKGKVIEAMAKGVPVAGTEAAFQGMPKDAGFLYKGTRTAEELASEITKAYQDKAYWEQLSRFGMDYVAANFNKENMKQVFKGIIG